MKLLLLAFLLSSNLLANEYYYSMANKSVISFEEFSSSISPGAQIVLGEYHNTESIQVAEGKIISQLVKHHGVEGDFMLAWEFLNYEDLADIVLNFDNYKNDRISGIELISTLFNGSENNLTYLHPLFAVKKFNGNLYGVNANRSIKRTIVERGLDAVDPRHIPPNMVLGGAHYLERFKIAMGNHIPPEKMAAYFLAQSYTDSVMAHWFQGWNHFSLNFLIVGAFHSDYKDGVVHQLNNINAEHTITVKIVDLTKMSDEEKKQVFIPHEKYGVLADYLYVIDDQK